jgi:hypothetical protein
MSQQQQPPPAQQPAQNTPTPQQAQQAQLIQQVLSLTPQQIDALSPEHRATILQIVSGPFFTFPSFLISPNRTSTKTNQMLLTLQRQQALSNMAGR